MWDTPLYGTVGQGWIEVVLSHLSEFGLHLYRQRSIENAKVITFEFGRNQKRKNQEQWAAFRLSQKKRNTRSAVNVTQEVTVLLLLAR